MQTNAEVSVGEDIQWEVVSIPELLAILEPLAALENENTFALKGIHSTYILVSCSQRFDEVAH